MTLFFVYIKIALLHGIYLKSDHVNFAFNLHFYKILKCQRVNLIFYVALKTKEQFTLSPKLSRMAHLKTSIYGADFFPSYCFNMYSSRIQRRLCGTTHEILQVVFEEFRQLYRIFVI